MLFFTKIVKWFANLKSKQDKDLEDFFWDLDHPAWQFERENYHPNQRTFILEEIYVLMEITAINDDLVAKGWTLEAAREHIVDLPLYKLQSIKDRMIAIADRQRKMDILRELIERAKQQERKKLKG